MILVPREPVTQEGGRYIVRWAAPSPQSRKQLTPAILVPSTVRYLLLHSERRIGHIIDSEYHSESKGSGWLVLLRLGTLFAIPTEYPFTPPRETVAIMKPTHFGLQELRHGTLIPLPREFRISA